MDIWLCQTHQSLVLQSRLLFNIYKPQFSFFYCCEGRPVAVWVHVCVSVYKSDPLYISDKLWPTACHFAWFFSPLLKKKGEGIKRILTCHLVLSRLIRSRNSYFHKRSGENWQWEQGCWGTQVRKYATDWGKGYILFFLLKQSMALPCWKTTVEDNSFCAW